MEKSIFEETSMSVKQIRLCASLKYIYNEITLRELPGKEQEEARNKRREELEKMNTVKEIKGALMKALGTEDEAFKFSPIVPNVTVYHILNPNNEKY